MTLKKLKLSLLLIAMAVVAWSCGGGFSAAPATSNIAAPTGVKAEAVNETTIKVTWIAVDKASGYIIYHSIFSGVANKSTAKLEVTSSATTGEVSGEITDLSAGTYYAVVVSKDANGESAVPSSEVSATLAAPIPVVAPPPAVATQSGVATHEGARWTRSDAGPTPAIWLNQASAGDTGEALGNRSVNKGRLTFKITGIASNLREAHRWIIWFKSNIGGESNFQLMVVTSQQTRLITQRFANFTDCRPRSLQGYWGCEEQDINGALAFQPDQTYLWDCSWDGTVSPKRVGCTVTTIGGTFSTAYEIGMGGAYGSLTELAVGSFSLFGYPEVRSTVSDFRFSIM
jgi:hypothetical protein